MGTLILIVISFSKYNRTDNIDIITSELIYILGAKMKNINEMDDEEKMEQLMN